MSFQCLTRQLLFHNLIGKVQPNICIERRNINLLNIRGSIATNNNKYSYLKSKAILDLNTDIKSSTCIITPTPIYSDHNLISTYFETPSKLSTKFNPDLTSFPDITKFNFFPANKTKLKSALYQTIWETELGRDSEVETMNLNFLRAIVQAAKIAKVPLKLRYKSSS